MKTILGIRCAGCCGKYATWEARLGKGELREGREGGVGGPPEGRVFQRPQPRGPFPAARIHLLAYPPVGST